MKAVLRSIDFEATARRPTRPVIDFLLAPDISNTINLKSSESEGRKESRLSDRELNNDLLEGNAIKFRKLFAIAPLYLEHFSSSSGCH